MSLKSIVPDENKPIETTTTTITASNPDRTKVYHSETSTIGVSNADNIGLSNVDNRGLPNVDSRGLSNVDNRGLSNVDNRGLSNVDNSGLSNMNNRVLSNMDSSSTSNVNNRVLSNMDSSSTSNVDKTVKKEEQRNDNQQANQKKMDSLLNNSCDMLTEVFNKNVYPDNRIPINLFQNCKGVMLLRIWKAGIGIGGMGGSGIVLAHNNQTWSQPCAVTLGGIQIGINLGVERVDDVLLLRDDAALRLFSEKGHFKLGLDTSFAVGPFGVDTNTSIAMGGNETKSIYAYSFAKGAFFGVSLDGGALSIDDKVNEEYYGRKVSVGDIFSGNVIAPQNNYFVKLLQLLNSYCYCAESSTNVTSVANVRPVM